MRYACWLIVSLLAAQHLAGQVLTRWAVPVIENGRQLPHPFAGGLNLPQFSQADWDQDDTLDLLVFDRASQAVLTYIFRGGEYLYSPEYQTHIPQLQNWALMTDLTCDGIPELLSSAADSSGIRVFSVDFTGGVPAFELWPRLLRSDEGLIFIAPTDVPALADVDADGDVDILGFDTGGSQVIWYQNQAAPVCDSALFVVETTCFGAFEEAGLNNQISLNVACKRGSGVSRHAGSSLTAFDRDADGDMELLIGDINHSNLVYLHNGGTLALAQMDQVLYSFPEVGIPADMPQFPAAYELDADHDGDKDLIIAPNLSNLSLNQQQVWYYDHDGSNPAQYTLESQQWLTADMIDRGEDTHPAFTDYNRDGLLDLVVGNHLSRTPAGEEAATLSLYENTGTATQPVFTLVNRNYLQLPTRFSPKLYAVRPAFGDLDGDGDDDLIIGDKNGRIHRFTNTAASGQPASYQLTHPDYQGIDVGGNATPQIVDLNRDGSPDLLIGEQSGNLNLYLNQGSPGNPVFTVADPAFGEVDVQPLCCTGFSVPFVFENENGAFELITGAENGELFHHTGIEGNLSGAFSLITSRFGDIRAGGRLSPAAADLNGDGLLDWVMGTRGGGLLLYTTAASLSVPAPVVSPQLYPNPGRGYVSISLPGAAPLQIESLEITDLTGRRFSVSSHLTTPDACRLDTQYLIPGIYQISVRDQQGQLYRARWVRLPE
ncbi:MAG: FG-GAP-like repeat-containing protein [Bacteroidia bacterium]|nr:FG-GAP-like repeat-containing protein [Bacteroidia bacterium]